MRAAHWLARLGEDPGAEAHAAFEAWRTAAPGHAEAWAQVARGAARARAFAEEPAILALRHETLARLATRATIGQRRQMIAAALALLVVAGSLVWMAQRTRGVTRDAAPLVASAVSYRTGAGERLAVTLADGSAVTLDARSAVHVDFGPGERRVELAEGQALFKVAGDPARPFVVHARGREVTALGTEFDVRLDSGGIRVALLEGSVVVREGERVVATMRPNEVLRVAGRTVSLARHQDMRRFTSWQDGLIMFADTPLGEAVDELNRYGTKRLVLGDAELGALRVSGTFKAGQNADFLEAIAELFPVRIARETTDSIVLARAAR